jgi:hypothetical protein
MPNETCDHGNTAPMDVLDDLPHSQAGTGRHKCAICAYEKGLEEGQRQAAVNPPVTPTVSGG